MKNMKIPAVHDMHPNVTPLIDIVMCLIIFYMLVARINVDRGDIPMNLPFSQQGIKIEDLGNTVTLNIEPGTVKTMGIDGKMLTMKAPESADRSNPAQTLKNYLIERKKINPEVKVIIRGDQDLQYQQLEPVLVACSQAQVKGYNLATKTRSN